MVAPESSICDISVCQQLVRILHPRPPAPLSGCPTPAAGPKPIEKAAARFPAGTGPVDQRISLPDYMLAQLHFLSLAVVNWAGLTPSRPVQSPWRRLDRLLQGFFFRFRRAGKLQRRRQSGETFRWPAEKIQGARTSIQEKPMALRRRHSQSQ